LCLVPQTSGLQIQATATNVYTGIGGVAWSVATGKVDPDLAHDRDVAMRLTGENLPVQVPEPATWLLLSIGAWVVALKRA
jgi:hypothetical protein